MRELRTEYLARFAALPGVALCEAHDGELDDDEVARVGVARTPAVLVTCLGSDELVDEFGEPAARMQWVAVVIARGADSVREGESTRGDVAAALALRIAHELTAGAPFDAALERSRAIKVANMAGTRAAKRGHAIWVVTWTAPTSIRPEDLDPILSDLTLVHTDYDFGPNKGVDAATNTDMTGGP